MEGRTPEESFPLGVLTVVILMAAVVLIISVRSNAFVFTDDSYVVGESFVFPGPEFIRFENPGMDSASIEIVGVPAPPLFSEIGHSLQGLTVLPDRSVMVIAEQTFLKAFPVEETIVRYSLRRCFPGPEFCIEVASTDTDDLGAPVGLTVNPDDLLLYFTNQETGCVGTYDISTDVVDGSVFCGGFFSLAELRELFFHPDGVGDYGVLYVTSDNGIILVDILDSGLQHRHVSPLFGEWVDCDLLPGAEGLDLLCLDLVSAQPFQLNMVRIDHHVKNSFEPFETSEVVPLFGTGPGGHDVYTASACRIYKVEADGFVTLLEDFCDTPDRAILDVSGFPWACSDGEDNDGDGFIDELDPGCGSPSWPVEDPQCSNGVNDDPEQDTAVDHPADTGCQDLADTEEFKKGSCGLGFEVLFLLAPLAWRRSS